MARKREVITYNGALRGKYLTESDCQRLDMLLSIWERGGSIPDLAGVITNLNSEEVNQVLETGVPIEEPEKGRLRDYQTVAVAYAYFAKRCMIGSSVGLGKTVITAGLLNLLKIEKEKKEGENGEKFSFLFLTDTNTIKQHEREFTKFTNMVCKATTGEKGRVAKLLGNTGLDERPNIIGSHSLLTQALFFDAVEEYRNKWGKNPFDIVVVDESSRVGVATGPFGGVKSKLYANTKWLIKDLDRVIGLNATPFEKNLMTFFGQLNLLDDTLMPTKTAFIDRYVVTAYQGRAWAEPTGEYKNEEEFQDLIRYRYLNQTRKDIGGVIEESSAELIEVDLTDVQKKLLRETSMPHMVYDAPWYFDDNEYGVNTGSTNKLKVLNEEVAKAVVERGNCLVYCHYKEAQYGVQYYLESRGDMTVEVLNGSMSFQEKNEAIDRFTSGETQVLVTNVQKGLNFNNCNDLIFYAPIGNPNTMVQVEGRITRELNIVDKHVKVIVTKGSEAEQFRKSIAQTALASETFAGADHSLVLNLLKKESLKAANGGKGKKQPDWVPDKAKKEPEKVETLNIEW